MRCVSTRFSWITLLTILLLAVSACAGNSEEEEESQVGNPTPELAVVEFATQAPTPTVEATNTPQSQPTPTQAATVGVGISNTPQPADTGQNVSPIAYFENRPPDVNPLTGLTVSDPAMLQRRPLMVRIGNDPGGRPQVALNEADMVYEEIVEWWVTRFTAIYLSADPETIAPIRSARLINLPLASQYRGVLANSGGSDGVRWEISQSDIINLDEYFVPGPYFYRPNEGWQTRLAIDATAARDYLANEGLDSNVGLRGFYFTGALEPSTLPQGAVSDAAVAEIPYPQQTSATRWQYDSGSGTYLRFVTGEPLMDFNGGQAAASNVIIYFADHQPTDIVEDSNGATSIRIIINGKGAAWLLRDGKVLTGNWETDGTETPMFAFDSGQPMPLKPGNTWVQVVPLEFTIDIDGVSYNSLDAASSPGGSGVPATGDDAAPTDEPATQPSPTFTPIGSRSTPEN